MDERPRWQIFLMAYALAFVAIFAIGLAFGDSFGEAARAALARGFIFGTTSALVLIGMSRVNRSHDDLESKHSDRGDARER